MVWRRLFGLGTTTTSERPPSPPPPQPKPTAKVQTAFGFTFERPTETKPTVQSPARPTPQPDVAAVVRSKAAKRKRAFDPASRGVAPVWVPSLSEQALAYRVAAEREVEPGLAAQLWTAYVELQPEDGPAWFVLGQLMLQLRRPGSAWAAFERVRVLDPTHALAAGAMGFLCMARGDAAAAREHYTEAARLRPNCPDMLAGLAQACESAGDEVQARAARARLERVIVHR